MKMLKFPSLLSVAACLLLASGICFASVNDVYISQNGGGSGSSCSSSLAVSYFNSSGSWTSATPSGDQIGPGTTVHLCGTITSALTAQGNGASGNPITILFDSNSSGQISDPALPNSGALVLNNRSYITVNGNNTGTIQSTNNGSSSSLCSGSTYANDTISVGIMAEGVNNVTIENLTIGPLYVHLCSADDAAKNPSLSPPGPVAIQFGGSNITISGNRMHDGAWLLFGTANNMVIANNTEYNLDHGLGAGITSNSATESGVYFYGNTIYGANVWDTDDNSFHHDGIHVWAYCADGSSFCSASHWRNVYIYNNHFYGNWGNHMNCFVFLEANVQNAYIFNNFADGSALQGYGAAVIDVVGGGNSIFNNTIISNGINTTFPSALAWGGPNSSVENNIITTSNSLLYNSTNWGGRSTSVTALSHDTYANGGLNSFVWCPPSGGSCGDYTASQFATWESSSGDTDSQYVSSAGLNSNGTLAAGSPAIGAGANLYSLCNGQPNPGLGALCYDAAGNARPATGSWDAGAFNSAGAGAPAPRTGLTATSR
jgi:hypothetical protein